MQIKTASISLSHLWREHVSDTVHCSLHHQTSHQEAEKHHIGEERAEVHHLGERHRDREIQVHHTALPWIRFPEASHMEEDLQQYTYSMNKSQPAFCLLGTKPLTKCEEDSLRFGKMSQKSFLHHFGEPLQRGPR